MDSNTTTYTKTFSIDLERANYHKKCKKRKLKRIITVIVIWILIIIYFLTPLSKLNLMVSGNNYYTKQELMEMAYLNKNELWWLVDEKKAISVLESYEYISSVEIKKSFFGTKMEIEEIYPVGVRNDLYVLNNNNLISKESYPLNNKIEKITNLDKIEETDLNYFITKYSRVNLSVRNKIEDVEIVKGYGDYRYVMVFGYDERIGHFVIKLDLVYLDTKFKENKYDKIVEEISKNNVKYSKDSPVLVAYLYLDEEEFHLVESFEGDSYE